MEFIKLNVIKSNGEMTERYVNVSQIRSFDTHSRTVMLQTCKAPFVVDEESSKRMEIELAYGPLKRLIFKIPFIYALLHKTKARRKEDEIAGNELS